MKKILFIALALVAGVAEAQTQRFASENQILTRAVPTSASFTATNTDGTGKALELGKLTAFRVSVCAESTRTLSGAGTLQAYLYDRKYGKVKRNPSLDLTITVTATSCQGAACRCQVFPNMSTGNVSAGDVLLYATNGVTVSGGTTVDIEYTGSTIP